MFLMAVVIGLIMTPIAYEEFRIDCSTAYECCVYCFIYVLGAGLVGSLLDICIKKECGK